CPSPVAALITSIDRAQPWICTDQPKSSAGTEGLPNVRTCYRPTKPGRRSRAPSAGPPCNRTPPETQPNSAPPHSPASVQVSADQRVGKSVDLGGRRIIKK